MLNNIYFVALHVLMCTVHSFVISSQGCSVKFDAALLLLIGPVGIHSVPHLPLTLPGLSI